MIQSFADEATEDIFDGKRSRKARHRLPSDLWRVAQRKLDQLNRVASLEDLRIPPGNMLEALKGARKGQYSIRVNEQYRLCFRWTPDGPSKVEFVDYH